MSFLLFLGAAIVVAALFVGIIYCFARQKSHELSETCEWFSGRLEVCPPQPLSPEYAAVVESIMDGDSDLWWHLGRGRYDVDRLPYYEQVIAFGRYLAVLGVHTAPSIYYGVFEDYGHSAFRVWIEFRRQSEIVWVLFDHGGSLQICRFASFRVNYPGLVHRHPVYFVTDGLDANVSS